MTVTKQEQLEWLALNIDNFFGCDVVHMSTHLIGEKRMVLDSKYHAITHEEWQQERDKMNSKPEVDSSWYERGELPPVGCECEILHKLWKDSDWAHIVVIALTRESLICKHKLGAGEEHYYLNDIAFRPLRTEREKSIDEMASLIAKSVFGSAKCQAEKLYDAGYRKVKS